MRLTDDITEPFFFQKSPFTLVQPLIPSMAICTRTEWDLGHSDPTQVHKGLVLSKTLICAVFKNNWELRQLKWLLGGVILNLKKGWRSRREQIYLPWGNTVHKGQQPTKGRGRHSSLITPSGIAFLGVLQVIIQNHQLNSNGCVLPPQWCSSQK